MPKRLPVALATFVVVSVTVASGAGPAGYLTHAELSQRVDRLATEHPQTCSSVAFGTSREGRALWALRLARPGEVDPDRRPALLLVANVDGDHVIGSAVALGVVEGLLARAAANDEAVVAFLDDHTLYVAPRVNPDGAERFFADVKAGQRRNVRPDDADRDGEMDEDPPDDVNRDGFVTMMRVPDPAKADRMADPGDSRLDVEPDRDEGERATFVLYTEGLDDDGDEAFNEDAAGGVDLDMNFMHGYQEHADGAGPHQVSEPESLALLEYVLAHQNIAVVLTYGRHDTLSKPPDGKGTYPAGTPKTIDPKDVGLYEAIGERFREITGLEKVPAAKGGGAFHEWAYAQFGVPSFSTPLWTRPEPEKKKEKDDGKGGADGGKAAGEGAGGGGGEDEGGTPSGIGDISQETIDELRAAAEGSGFEVTDEMVAQLNPAQVEGFARRMGVEIKRVKTKEGDGGDGKAKSKEEAAWLAYSDDVSEGAGFVAWTPFDHPQLGPVEIGGWVPYFKVNPPPEAIPALAGKQVEFVLDLAGRLPRVSLAEPEIVRLAPGLYEVETALVNDGRLPTGTAMAVRNRRARPYVVRLSVPVEAILTGRRVNKIWSIPAAGGRSPFRWIIRAEDGTEMTITVYSEKFGEFARTVWLRESAKGGAE